jgi:hypothetical protein
MVGQMRCLYRMLIGYVVLDGIVDTLKTDNAGDHAIAQVFLHKFVEKLEKDKKGKRTAHVGCSDTPQRDDHAHDLA